jgi:DHA1 family bicyclomycin/chloramphenicol resistance-like MFS transporter
VTAYLLGSVVANRYGARIGLDRSILISAWLVLAGAALMVLCAALLPLSIAAVIGPYMLWAGGMGVALPNSMAGAMAPFPRIAGSASALMGFAQMGVGALGSAFLAQLGSEIGGRVTALPLALVLLGFAGLGYGLWFALVWRRSPA